MKAHLIVALSAAALSLAACNKDEPPKPPAPKTTPAAATTPAPKADEAKPMPPAAPTAAPADGGKK